jgi:AcrR family transcriptional regulator
MDGFARRKEQSKNSIRKAAWELFSQFGMERVSIADIAHKAGVSPATIYNNFDGKESLVREFVATAIDQLVNRVQEVLVPRKPYLQKMAAFVQCISEIIAHEGPPIVDGTVFTSSLDLQNDPEIKEIRHLAQEKMTDLLLGLVREGQDQGQVSLGISEEAFRLYFKAFMDVFTNPQLQGRFANEPQLVHDLGLLMTYGLFARERGS